MILGIQQGLAADGVVVSLAKLCRWFGVPRRTVYYRAVKSPPKVNPKFAEPIKAMIEESPSFGYRTVAHLLGLNKNTVQRILPDPGLASEEAPPRLSASDSGAAFGCDGAQRALVHRPLPRVGGSGPLGHAGAGDRLPHARTPWLAPVAQRQGLHGGQCVGARIDRPL